MERKFKSLKSLIFSIYEDEYSNNEIDQTIKNIFNLIKNIFRWQHTLLSDYLSIFL